MKYTTPECLQGKTIRITMIGCGGTGSEMLRLLTKTQMAIQKLAPDHQGIMLTLYDGDSVSDANIGRQGFYQGDQGYNKAELSISRINTFHGFNWIAKPSFFDATELERHRNIADLIITCTDSAKFRGLMGETGKRLPKSDLLWLDSGNGQFTGQVVLGHLAAESKGDLRLPNVYDLYPELLTMPEDDEPSCSLEAALSKQDLMVNVMPAVWMNNLIWSLIRHGGIDTHGVLFDLRKNLSIPLKIDQATWASMGLQ